MSNLNGAVFDFTHIAGMINHISEIANAEYNLELTTEAKEIIIESVLSHYYDHINAYTVTVSGSDPYKFMSWAGVFIYENLYESNRQQAIKFLSSAIAALHNALMLEGKELPTWYLRKALKMVISEFNNNNHIGLGANGLYMAFKGASLVNNEQ